MPSKDLKNKKIYSQEALERALKEIREEGRGIRQTCKKYGIPKTTIQDRISGKRTDDLKNRGPEPVLGLNMEKEIVQWISNITKCGFLVKKQELLDTVQKILKDHQRANPFKDDRPGQTWYLNFLKRNPEISVRSEEGINKSRAHVTEESIRQWFRELDIFLSDSGRLDILKHPERIFNADESGFSLCPKTGKVLGPNGSRNLYQNEKDNLTVLINFNANGQMCPPLVVFSYLSPPKTIIETMPPEWTLGRSESGRMRTEIFFEYIVNDFNSWLEKNTIQKPVLLLVDGHKSHMSLALSNKCKELGIILYALPPNTTHIMQPAEVSVFAPLKVNWEKEVCSFLSKSENFNSSITETNFCQLFKNFIENSQIEKCIKHGFRRCGLFPFDPDGVDYTICVQNKMERLNRSRVCKQTDITNEDLVSTRKVIRHLTPILQKNNVDINFILREVKKLRQTVPTPSEFFYETESQDRTNSTIRLSTSLLNDGERNLNNFDPIASTSALYYLHSLNKNNISDQESDDGGVDLNDTYCVDVPLLPQPIENVFINAEIPKDNAIESDEHKDSESLVKNFDLEDKDTINRQILSYQGAIEEVNKEESLATLHLSGSYLEQRSSVSLDNSVTIPIQTKIECQTIVTPSRSYHNESKPMVSGDNVTAILSESNTPATNALSKHLFVPQPLEKLKNNNPESRIPAAMSSYNEEKEKIKEEEKESIKRKHKATKREKDEKGNIKKQKRLKRSKTEMENEENDNVKQTYCAQCDVILNSDAEEDEDKNVGCDFCTNWFHLKCTDFIGLAYNVVKDRVFKCNFCVTEED